MAHPPRVIRIKSSAEFNWLLDHLVTEVHRAWDNWYIWGCLDAAVSDYGSEMNHSPQFWNLTIRAHQDSVILRLGRLSDPHSKALSLGNLVSTIHHAATSGFSCLKLSASASDLAGLQADMESASERDPLVYRLIELRNEYLAHRSSRVVATRSFAQLPKLEQQDIEALLKRALDIANRCCILCGRPVTLLGYPGRDDYRQLLDLLRLGLQAERQNR